MRDGDGAPVCDAWIAVPKLGRLAMSGPDGRFRVPACRGNARGARRGRDGLESVVSVRVPGEILDVVLGAAAATAG